MNGLRRFTVAMVALGLAGCSSGPKIETDYNPSSVAQMQAYRTWDFLASPSGHDQEISAIMVDRIKGAVTSTLTSKGLQQSSSNPDFKVGYHVTAQQQTSYTTVNNTYGYGGVGWGRWGGMGGMGMSTGVSTTQANHWTEGTLVIDVVDAKSDSLVWRGVGQGEVSKSASAQQRNENVDQGIAKMFANFPPSS